MRAFGSPCSAMYLAISGAPSFLTSRSTTKTLFRIPVGMSVLKRCGLEAGFCWLHGSFHLVLGSFPFGWTGNFQKSAKGSLFCVRVGVACIGCISAVLASILIYNWFKPFFSLCCWACVATVRSNTCWVVYSRTLVQFIDLNSKHVCLKCLVTLPESFAQHTFDSF